MSELTSIQMPFGMCKLLREKDRYYAYREGPDGIEISPVIEENDKYVVEFSFGESPDETKKYPIMEPEYYFGGEDKRINFFAPSKLVHQFDKLLDKRGENRSKTLRRLMEIAVKYKILDEKDLHTYIEKMETP